VLRFHVEPRCVRIWTICRDYYQPYTESKERLVPGSLPVGNHSLLTQTKRNIRSDSDTHTVSSSAWQSGSSSNRRDLRVPTTERREGEPFANKGNDLRPKSSSAGSRPNRTVHPFVELDCLQLRSQLLRGGIWPGPRQVAEGKITLRPPPCLSAACVQPLERPEPKPGARHRPFLRCPANRCLGCGLRRGDIKAHRAARRPSSGRKPSRLKAWPQIDERNDQGTSREKCALRGKCEPASAVGNFCPP